MALNRDDFYAEMRELLVNDLFVELPADEIGVQDSLRDVVGVDSLGFAEIMATLEDKYGIKIEDGEFSPENFGTLERLADLVERKTA